MAKEILIYGDIYSYSVERFIDAMNEIEEDGQDELTARVNSNGGNPQDLVGMRAKWLEFTGKKRIKVDGKAYSSAAFFLLDTPKENIEATQDSRFMFHRAGFPSYMEDGGLSDEQKSYLDPINKTLRASMEARIDKDDFKKVTGVTFNQLFSNDSRIDVFLDAKEAKKLGLISKIVALTPKKEKKISAMFDIAASYKGIHLADFDSSDDIEAGDSSLNLNQNKKKMTTVDELKAQHPSIFADVQNAAIAAERDRVGAWAAFYDVDAKKVIEGIKSGDNVTATVMAEMTMAATVNREISNLEASSADPITTETPASEKSVEAKSMEELAAFEKELLG